MEIFSSMEIEINKMIFGNNTRANEMKEGKYRFYRKKRIREYHFSYPNYKQKKNYRRYFEISRA